VILEGEEAERETLSVFYGADYAGGDEAFGIMEPLEINDETDVARLPHSFSEADISSLFEQVYLEKSGVRCNRICCLCFHLRALTSD
jgi:hypothetical protein